MGAWGSEPGTAFAHGVCAGKSAVVEPRLVFRSSPCASSLLPRSSSTASLPAVHASSPESPLLRPCTPRPPLPLLLPVPSGCGSADVSEPQIVHVHDMAAEVPTAAVSPREPLVGGAGATSPVSIASKLFHSREVALGLADPAPEPLLPRLPAGFSAGGWPRSYQVMGWRATEICRRDVFAVVRVKSFCGWHKGRSPFPLRRRADFDCVIL